MNQKKTKQLNQVISILNRRSIPFIVLNGSSDLPIHIRITGFGDIWPSTASFMIDGVLIKNNIKALIDALDAMKTIEKESNDMSDRIELLENAVKTLIVKVDALEKEKNEYRGAALPK